MRDKHAPPKFKQGDWVTSTNGNHYIITSYRMWADSTQWYNAVNLNTGKRANPREDQLKKYEEQK